jgi:hypothetical protein
MWNYQCHPVVQDVIAQMMVSRFVSETRAKFWALVEQKAEDANHRIEVIQRRLSRPGLVKRQYRTALESSLQGIAERNPSSGGGQSSQHRTHDLGA